MEYQQGRITGCWVTATVSVWDGAHARLGCRGLDEAADCVGDDERSIQDGIVYAYLESIVFRALGPGHQCLNTLCSLLNSSCRILHLLGYEIGRAHV